MKKLTLIAAIGAGLALSVAPSKAQLHFDSDTGALININGTSITFSLGTTGNDFHIDTAGSAQGDEGTFGAGDTFTIGSISPDGSGQVANVTGTGTVSIGNSTVGTLQGNISFVEILSSGTGVTLNDNGVINLNDLVFTPGTTSNPALAEIAQNTLGILTLNFTLIPGQSLTEITTGPGVSSSYSGTIASAPVPEANTVVAGALMLLPLGIGAIRAIRKERVA